MTIKEIFHDAGMSHYDNQEGASLLKEVLSDPLIQIKTTTGSLIIDPSFSLEQQVIISTNPLYEKPFIDFVNEKINKTIVQLRMSPRELRSMEAIRDEKDFTKKLRQLTLFLRHCPIPYFG